MRMLTLLVLMLVAVTASAQQIDLKSLDKVAAKAKNKTDINMDEAMVKSAAGFLDQNKGDEALAKKTVEGLKGLYLRVYEFDRKGAYTLDDLKPVLDQLKAPDWTAFLQSKEDGEQTEIWMHRTKVVPEQSAPVRQARAQMEGAKARLDRATELADRGLLAKPELDAATAAYKVTEAQYAAALDEAGDGEVDGIVLVSAEDDEVVVINALGVVRLQDLAMLGEFGTFAANAALKSGPPVKPQPAGK